MSKYITDSNVYVNIYLKLFFRKEKMVKHIVVLMMLFPLALAPIVVHMELTIIVFVFILVILVTTGFFSHEKRGKSRKRDFHLSLDVFYQDLGAIGPWLIPSYYPIVVSRETPLERSEPVGKQKS